MLQPYLQFYNQTYVPAHSTGWNRVCHGMGEFIGFFLMVYYPLGGLIFFAAWLMGFMIELHLERKQTQKLIWYHVNYFWLIVMGGLLSIYYSQVGVVIALWWVPFLFHALGHLVGRQHHSYITQTSLPFFHKTAGVMHVVNDVLGRNTVPQQK